VGYGGAVFQWRSPGGNWYNFNIDTDQWKAAFSAEPSYNPAFPTRPMTLHEFLTHLEKNGQVCVELTNHKVTRDKVLQVGGEEKVTYGVIQDEKCVFQFSANLTKTKKYRAENLACMVSANLVKQSLHVKPYIRMKCPPQCQAPTVCNHTRMHQSTTTQVHGGTHRRSASLRPVCRPSGWRSPFDW
jgi:hypothetical protein